MIKNLETQLQNMLLYNMFIMVCIKFVINSHLIVRPYKFIVNFHSSSVFINTAKSLNNYNIKHNSTFNLRNTELINMLCGLFKKDNGIKQLGPTSNNIYKPIAYKND